MTPQVYVPDESDERLARARQRRMRRRLAVLVVLLALAVGAWFVFGPSRQLRGSGDGFRSEVVPPIPTVGPSDSAYAARRAPYRIQVASVTTRQQASGIATKLRVDGWNVDVVDDSSERRFRVEVGPYVNRDEAEQVARRLRDGWGPGVLLVERK